MTSAADTPRTHLTTLAYDGPLAALRDAERVQRDLLEAIDNPPALFPDPEHLEFLTRRALQLIEASIDVHLDAGW